VRMERPDGRVGGFMGENTGSRYYRNNTLSKITNQAIFGAIWRSGRVVLQVRLYDEPSLSRYPGACPQDSALRVVRLSLDWMSAY